MKQLQNIMRHFYGNRITIIFSMVTTLFFPHVSLFSQPDPNGTNKTIRAKDSLNDIVIHQEINFKVSPARVYETLLSSKEFSECTKRSFPDFTEMSARIDSSVGGTFSLFDGHIIGRILELVPNERIVEAWRVVDWPAGIYSVAKFELIQQGPGTHLIFDHTGFPEGLKEHLSIGWQQHYWDALSHYFQ
jgi:activator of HSP90 ATPase